MNRAEEEAFRAIVLAETSDEGRLLLAWATPADGGNGPLLNSAFETMWRASNGHQAR